MAADVARAVTDEQVATMAFTRAANLNWVAARADEADRVLEAARERLEPAAARAVLDSVGAAFITQRGHAEQALATADRLLAAPDDCPPIATMMAEFAATDALAVLGRADEIAARVAHGHAALDLTPQMGIMRHGLGMGHFNGLLIAGYLDEADRAVDFYAAYSDAAAALSGSILMHGYHATSLFRSRIALERGRLRTALRIGQDAAAGFAEEDPGTWAFLVALFLCQTIAATGDADGAAAAFADVERFYRPTTQGLYAPIVVLCQAWQAAAAGTPSRARALAHDAAALAASLHHHAVEAPARCGR